MKATRDLLEMNNDEVDEMDIDIAINRDKDLKLPHISRYHNNTIT